MNEWRIKHGTAEVGRLTLNTGSTLEEIGGDTPPDDDDGTMDRIAVVGTNLSQYLIFDTAWHAWQVVSNADWKMYCTVRAGQGFNGVQVCLLDQQEYFSGNNPARPVNNTWNRVLGRIKIANDAGLYVALGLCPSTRYTFSDPDWRDMHRTPGYNVNDPQVYGQYVASRVRGWAGICWIQIHSYDAYWWRTKPNVAASVDGNYIKAVAAGIREADPSRLITRHAASPTLSHQSEALSDLHHIDYGQSGHTAERKVAYIAGKRTSTHPWGVGESAYDGIASNITPAVITQNTADAHSGKAAFNSYGHIDICTFGSRWKTLLNTQGLGAFRQAEGI